MTHPTCENEIFSQAALLSQKAGTGALVLCVRKVAASDVHVLAGNHVSVSILFCHFHIKMDALCLVQINLKMINVFKITLFKVVSQCGFTLC